MTVKEITFNNNFIQFIDGSDYSLELHRQENGFLLGLGKNGNLTSFFLDEDEAKELAKWIWTNKVK